MGRFDKSLFSGLWSIGNDTGINNLTPQLNQSAQQGKAVRIVDLARADGLPRFNQFVACREYGNTQSSKELELPNPHRSNQPEMLWPQNGPCRNNGFTLGNIIACLTNMIALAHLGLYLHLIPDHRAALLHHHRICPIRNGCSGKYSGSSARFEGLAMGSCRNTLAHLKPNRSASTEISCSYCITVHGAIVKRGNSKVRFHRLSTDSPKSRFKFNILLFTNWSDISK